MMRNKKPLPRRVWNGMTRNSILVADSYVTSLFFFFSSRRRHTRLQGDWSSDVCSSDLPLLFQTGETAYGKPVVDGQHPHDFLMELSAQYSHPIAESTSLLLHFAPVGDRKSVV